MDTLRENEQIKQYLNDVAQAMYLCVPREERLEVRQELRQHIEAMVEAEKGSGVPTDAAVTLVLDRFGNPYAVGRELRKRWLQKHPTAMHSVPVLSSAWWTTFAIIVMFCRSALGWFFPQVSFPHADTTLPDALWNGIINGMSFVLTAQVIHIILRIKYSGNRTNEIPKVSLERRAQLRAEESETSVTPESLERLRMTHRNINAIRTTFPLIFSGGLLLMLFLALDVFDLPAHQQSLWCYNIAALITVDLISRVFEMAQRRNGIKKLA